MLNKIEIEKAINLAIIEINQYIEKYNRPIESFKIFFQVLNEIKNELINNDAYFSKSTLMRFKFLCLYTIKNFEGSSFDEPIFFIANQFLENIPNYNSLELLS